jgi:LuxR family maltose regulon positive regulatory protein
VGRALALGGQLESAESYLQRAEGALLDVAQPDSELLHGQIAAVRASIAIQRADVPRTIEHARQAVSRLPRSEPFARSLAAFNLGDAHLLTGDVVPASAALADAAELSLVTGSLHMFTVSSAYLARTEILRGRLREAEGVCRRALSVVAQVSASPGRTIPTLGMLYAYLGQLRRELDDLDGAGRYLGQALELGEQSGYVEALAASYWALAQLRRAQLDTPNGLAMIDRAIETVEGHSLTGMRRLLLADRADLLVALGRLEEAESWARELRVEEALDLGLSQERECLSLVRLRLARGEVAEASRLLARLLGPAEAAGRFGVVIEILALQALALHESRKLTPALNVLERALVLAEPEGYVRTFADHGEHMGALLRQVAARGIAPEYVGRLLAAIASPGQGSPEPALAAGTAGEPATQHTRPKPTSDGESPPTQSGIEPLTAREVEVLRLLAGGASNQAIAAELMVSVGTVKAHVSHILGKLGAHSRTEGVARARELGLLRQG